MAVEDTWHPARLIPTVGIKGQDEQERRATACLLAVMRAVPEFGHAVLGPLGAPRSAVVETFAEVRFAGPEGKTLIPDGGIVCRRGRRTWRCLVEVKTGKAALREDQVGAYLDLARDSGIDGVLTISNQITAAADEHPIAVDGRKLRKTNLWHLSWWGVITAAVVQRRYRGISDPDQAWILDELIAYLQHPASGVGDFEDMGEHWVAVRKAAHDGTLRAGDAAARQVAERWHQFVQYLCLGLSQELGRAVSAPRPRKQTSQAQVDETVKGLAGTGVLEAGLRIPDAISDLRLTADLRARQTSLSVTLEAPRDGRPKTRINWLLRQLREAGDDLRIEVAYPNARDTTGALLVDVRDNPDRLLYGPDPKREPRRFVLTASRGMGQKRGKGEGSFVRETAQQTFDFYGQLVQGLRPWAPKAPQLREADDAESNAVDGPAPVPLTEDAPLSSGG